MRPASLRVIVAGGSLGIPILRITQWHLGSVHVLAMLTRMGETMQLLAGAKFTTELLNLQHVFPSWEHLRILICLHFWILSLPLSQVGISIVLLLISWAACSAHYKKSPKIKSGSTSISSFHFSAPLQKTG